MPGRLRIDASVDPDSLLQILTREKVKGDNSNQKSNSYGDKIESNKRWWHCRESRGL